MGGAARSPRGRARNLTTVTGAAPIVACVARKAARPRQTAEKSRRGFL